MSAAHALKEVPYTTTSSDDALRATIVKTCRAYAKSRFFFDKQPEGDEDFYVYVFLRPYDPTRTSIDPQRVEEVRQEYQLWLVSDPCTGNIYDMYERALADIMHFPKKRVGPA